MGCEVIRDETGEVTMIICRGRGKVKVCHECGRPSKYLCDFPLTGPKKGKTCDLPMCEQHRYNQGPEIDYCRVHHEMAKQEPHAG